jgi:hypothetical protein
VKEILVVYGQTCKTFFITLLETFNDVITLQYSNHTTQKWEIIGVVEIWRVNNYFTYRIPTSLARVWIIKRGAYCFCFCYIFSWTFTNYSFCFCYIFLEFSLIIRFVFVFVIFFLELSLTIRFVFGFVIFFLEVSQDE